MPVHVRDALGNSVEPEAEARLEDCLGVGRDDVGRLLSTFDTPTPADTQEDSSDNVPSKHRADWRGGDVREDGPTGKSEVGRRC